MTLEKQDLSEGVPDVECPDCKGRGEVFGVCCAYCEGRGRVSRAEVEAVESELGE